MGAEYVNQPAVDEAQYFAQRIGNWLVSRGIKKPEVKDAKQV
jgi:hypothetical protein